MTKKRSHRIVGAITLLIMMFGLAAGMSLKADNRYFMTVKNDKVSVINSNPTHDGPLYEHEQTNLIWIYNDQQSIAVQMPVHKQQSLFLHYVSNHTQNLPIWCELIQSKGYLAPYNAFNTSTNHMLKGYRLTKPAYHDTTVNQAYEEIQKFIKIFLQLNNLTSLNLRMEDTFMLKIQVQNAPTIITDYALAGISIKYLFPTVTKDQVPSQLLHIPSWDTQSQQFSTLNHNDYLKQNTFTALERKLYGRGLHKWINHTIVLEDAVDIELQALAGQCYYEFTDILPQSTYVDSDQRRIETTNYETINIQKPAFAAKQYFYKYRVPLTELEQSGVRRYSYHQPIHFRYPSPSLLNYTKVYLHPIVDARIVCNDHQQSSQSQTTGNERIVYRVEENLLYERGTAKIPNGDISKAKIVSITTLVVCLIAALVIIRKLK